MSRRAWKTVEDLWGVIRLDRIEFRTSHATAARARRFLMVEAAKGSIVQAEERASNIRFRGNKRFRTVRAVAFRVVAPREQSPELQIRLAGELGCSAQNPHYYLRERELR